MDLQLLEHSRARPSLRRCPFSRGPIINVPVRFVHKLGGKKMINFTQRGRRVVQRTLSNSERVSASIAPRCSCANVLRRRSLSSVPRLRLWYMRRARVVSMGSPGRGSGLGGGVSAGDAVDAMCSGVWGIDQGSFHFTADEDRCLVETLRCNARVREMKWRRKMDIVVR
jgi:hypothetical protein